MTENPFERKTDGVGELPTVEQIEEFRTLMTDIMHSLGRGVRLGRMDEIARTRIGTEYFLPGAHTTKRSPRGAACAYVPDAARRLATW